ncbi:unnamed protein product, partial [Discosporangium mesarthrocarpum]
PPFLLFSSVCSQVSDEEYFQTVACSPGVPGHIKVHNDNLRFVNWWDDDASPSIITDGRAVAAANSGALFGRKFSADTVGGREGLSWVQRYL